MIDQACDRCADRVAECTVSTVDQCLACNTLFVTKKTCVYFTDVDNYTSTDYFECVKGAFWQVPTASGDGFKTMRPCGRSSSRWLACFRFRR